MPASELRKQTARINGSKSRGPITPEGKIRSSQNAIKHGLSSDRLTRTLVLALEDQPGFNQLLALLEAEHQPATITERALVAKLAAALWRQLRCWGVETQVLDNEASLRRDFHRHHTPEARIMFAFQAIGESTRSLDLLHLYDSRLDRQFHRVLNQLNRAKMDKRTQHLAENTDAGETSNPNLTLLPKFQVNRSVATRVA